MRKWTNKLVDAIDDGIVSYKDVVTMCLNYMSEEDVQDMIEANDLIDELGED